VERPKAGGDAEPSLVAQQQGYFAGAAPRLLHGAPPCPPNSATGTTRPSTTTSSLTTAPSRRRTFWRRPTPSTPRPPRATACWSPPAAAAAWRWSWPVAAGRSAGSMATRT